MHWLEFAAYFLVALAFFSAIWWGSHKAYDKFDERERRHFEEKVDRYRRGHR